MRCWAVVPPPIIWLQARLQSEYEAWQVRAQAFPASVVYFGIGGAGFWIAQLRMQTNKNASALLLTPVPPPAC